MGCSTHLQCVGCWPPSNGPAAAAAAAAVAAPPQGVHTCFKLKGRGPMVAESIHHYCTRSRNFWGPWEAPKLNLSSTLAQIYVEYRAFLSGQCYCLSNGGAVKNRAPGDVPEQSLINTLEAAEQTGPCGVGAEGCPGACMLGKDIEFWKWQNMGRIPACMSSNLIQGAEFQPQNTVHVGNLQWQELMWSFRVRIVICSKNI